MFQKRSNSVPKQRRPLANDRRRGGIAVLSAVMMVILLAMAAFAIDLGFVATVRTELQRSADAGALAGAGALPYGPEAAADAARQYVSANSVGGVSVNPEDIEIELGTWDPVTYTYVPGSELPTAVRVRVDRNNGGLFFGPVLGESSYNAAAESVATFQPRDIMLVLDYSASMNDDSELKKISQLGRTAVEDNLWDIYNELGAPSCGNMPWKPTLLTTLTGSVNSILQILGLDTEPYPYPSGSWSDFVNYVKNDGTVNAAGYRDKYCILVWVNYLLQNKPRAAETPDLWMTSEQPLTAVKDSVSLFINYIQQVDTDDQMGLSVYTSASGGAVLETGLTSDFPLVETITRQRQAGHYDLYTNIGAGMQTARIELEQNARPGALKLMVLMTDGIANRPSDTTTARAFALSEADLAAAAKIPIITISLGSGADVNLMQQIADVTGGRHFNIPGGQTVAEYEADLKDVFRAIADDRPLKLVR